MPWTSKDAQRHTRKAKTPRLQRMWADVANGELKKHGDDARAVRTANGVVAERAGPTKAGGRRPKR